MLYNFNILQVYYNIFVIYHYHILLAELVLGTCIVYLADSDIIEKWRYWLNRANTNTNARISAALTYIHITLYNNLQMKLAL